MTKKAEDDIVERLMVRRARALTAQQEGDGDD